MRILYFLAHPEGIGGAAKVMIKHATIMKRLGNEVMVVIQTARDGTYTNAYDDICNSMGVEHCALSYSIAICIEEVDIYSAIHEISDIENVIKKYNPDIIHSLQIIIAVEAASRMVGVPNIMSVYQASPEMFGIKWPDIFAQYHLTDSEYYSRIWKVGLGVESKCIRVPYEVSLNKIEKEKSEVIEIVNVAALLEHKRQYEILKGVLLCLTKGIRVHITFVGDDSGSYGDKCKEFVYDNGIQEYVEFTGYVNDVEKYLNRSDVMIHASVSESYPGVIVEAMANGLPVIATPVAGIPEILKDEENGFIIDGFDAQAIYDAFLRFVQARENQKDALIRENARNTYLNYHTYEKVGEELSSFQNMVLKTYDNRRKDILFDVYERIDRCIGSRLKDNCSEYTLARAFYLYHIYGLCREKGYSSVVIWGAGESGRIGIEWAEVLGLDIVSFVDSQKKGYYEEYEILAPSIDNLKKGDIVMVSVLKDEAIRSILENLDSYGLVRNEDFFLVYNSPVW